MAAQLTCSIAIRISEADVRSAIADAINRQYGMAILPDRIKWEYGLEYEDKRFDGASIELRLDEAVSVESADRSNQQ